MKRNLFFKLLVFCFALNLLSCSGGIKTEKIDYTYTFCERSSKVWMAKLVGLGDNVIEESTSIEGTLFIFYASGKFVFGDLKALAKNNYQSGTYKLDNENDNLQIQINGKKWDFNFEVSSNMEIILRPTIDSETNYSYLLIPFPEP
jgi:hypothetical protein